MLRYLTKLLGRNRQRKEDEVPRAGVGFSQATRALPVALNLGIDFGTSFTKVSYRDVGREESGIVTFGSDSADGAIIPSIVSINSSGALACDSPGQQHHLDAVSVPYLKMRLADVSLGGQLPFVIGIDLNAPDVIRGLASWFLANVIRRAQAWILTAEAERLKGRAIQWTGNVCVPVEHYDSALVDGFREMASVAWEWAEANTIPVHVQDLVQRYRETVRTVSQKPSSCHTVPEIAAAVYSFITSRTATPGIYVYFDVGGGTLDGVAFDYVNWDGERRINFYAGKVVPLGVESIANRFDSQNARQLKDALISAKIDPAIASTLEIAAREVRQLVGEVVMTAKSKDYRDWQRDVIQTTTVPRRTLAMPKVSRMVPLIVFVGGGGAGAAWYQRTIYSTYEAFAHVHAGIPPYELAEVPKPSGLNMNGLMDSEFRRFVIAYGLSVPFGEGPEIGLPSQFSKVERPRQFPRRNSVADYSDSKDIYD